MPAQPDKLIQQGGALGRALGKALAYAEAKRLGLDPVARQRQRYWADPVLWAEECIAWKEGEGLTDYQSDVLRNLVEYKREAVYGPRGLGKTMLASIAILWYADTRDGLDWKVGTTAGSWRQLANYLWPEVHKWARRVKADVCVRGRPWGRGELLQLMLKGTTGQASAAASDDPATIEGMHADNVLFVFDESKIIPAKTFDSIEGIFSGAGADATQDALVLAISTPGEPNGRFHQICTREQGTEDWHVDHVTFEQCVAAGRMSLVWAEQRRQQWGETSAAYANHVLGEFATSDEDGVIPFAWIEAAVERWTAKYGEGYTLDRLDHIGVDVAYTGDDRTVLALRRGLAILELRDYAKQDTQATAGIVKGIVKAHGGVPVVDVIGIGAGVYDRLKEEGCEPIGFNASASSTVKDHTGELGFTNQRSQGWWHLRELLDPAYGAELALPPHDQLIGDLSAPHWKVIGTGKIQVEPKPEIKKRLGRSTDFGDAVMQAMSENAAAGWLEYLDESVVDCPGCQLPAMDFGEGPNWLCQRCGCRIWRCPDCRNPYDADKAGRCSYCDTELPRHAA